MGPRFRNPAIILAALFLLSALAQAQSVPGSFFPMTGDLWAYDADNHGCGWVTPNDTPVSLTAASGRIHLTCNWAAGSFDGYVTYTVPSVTPPATQDAGAPYMYRFDAGKTLPIAVQVTGTWTHPALTAGMTSLISAQSFAGEAGFGQCGVPTDPNQHQDISADTVNLSITCNLTALATDGRSSLPHPMGWTTFSGDLWFFTGPPAQIKSFPLTEANIFWRINVYYDFATTPNVKIDHVELVQRTQTVSGGVNAMGVPLVATLPTLVRVFVAPGNSQAQPAVTGTLTVTYADKLVETKQGTTVTPVASPDRNNLSSSLNFYLLRPYYGDYHPGAAQFSVRLTTAAGQDLNVSQTFSAQLLGLSSTFSDYNIAYLPICYRGPGMITSSCPEGENLASWNNLFPLGRDGGGLDALPGPPLVWDIPLNSTAVLPMSPAAQRLNNAVLLLLFLEQCVAYLRPNYHDAFGGLPDLSYPVKGAADGLSVAWAQQISGADGLAWRSNVWHQLGRNLGLSTAGQPNNPIDMLGCGLPDAPNWPYQDSDIQQPGWGDWVMKLHPSTSHDIMSRCLTNTWLSPFSWDKLLNYFLANPINTIFPTSKPAVPAAAASSFLLVSGIAGQNGAATSLSPVRTLPSGPADTSNPNGRYCVVTTGSAGQSSSCFEPNFNLVDGDGAANQSPFSLVVPAPAGLTRVALTFQGSELAALVPSPNAPQVAITAPLANARWTTGQMTLQWNGTDADGDSLQYDVLYSSDGKTTWTPLTAGRQNTQFTVDVGNLVASNQTWFRVVALDGVNTGTADAGPIQVVNQASVAVSPATLDFGKPPANNLSTQTVQISNTGTGALRITAASVDNPAFLPSLPPSGLWIVPGGSAVIGVDLNTTAVGAQSGTLSLTTNDPQQPKKTISLAASVTALPQPAIAIDQASLLFGQVNIGATAQLAFNITNAGYATLSIQSIASGSAEFTVSAAGPFDVPDAGARVVVSFQPAAAGLKLASLTIASNDPNKPSVTVALSASAVTSGGTLPPFVGTGGVVDGAQFSTPVAPGAIASVFGSNLVNAISVANTVPLPTDLGVKVLVDGVNAPLYGAYTGPPTQINFQVPFETAVDHNAQVVVVRGGISSSPVTVPVRLYAPAVFLNWTTGDPIVTRYPDGAYITKSNPARANDILLVYVTGFGDVASPPATGAAAVAQPLPSTVDTVTASLGGVPVTVLYGGLTPGSVGLAQVNIQLPNSLPAASGNTLPLVFSVAGFQSQTVPLPVGAAAVPAISISPASLDFGSVTVGQNKQLAVTISNTGTAPLNVTAATVTNTAFTWTGPAIPFTLAAGAQAVGAVWFAPSAAGAQSGSLTIASTDPAHPSLSAALTGTGAAAVPKLTVDQTSLAFGSVPVGQYKDLALTIGNTGAAALNVTSISSSNAAFRASVATLTVAPGASTPIGVRFTPTAAGSQTGSLTFASNDPAGGGVSVALSGTGAVPSLAFSPASLDFGSVVTGQTKDLTLAISNSGTAPLTVSSAASTNSAFTVQTPAPPYTIAAGGQQTMTVRFAPTAAGAQTGTLNLAGNDPAHPTTPVPLTGTGISISSGPPPRPSGSVLDFNNPLSTSLAGLFLMNEAQGPWDSNIVDGQGAGFSGPSFPSWNTSDPSLAFNGGGSLNSYLNAGADLAFDKLPVGKMTIAAKVFVGANALAAGGICEKNDGNASNGDGFLFGWDSFGTLRFTIERSQQNMRVYTASGSVPTGRWTQVAVTWDGTVGGAASAHVFVDGVEQAKTTSQDGSGTMGYAHATNQPFRIGNASFDVPGSFYGKMAYLAVYNGRILTPAEMIQLDARLPIRAE